MSSVRLSLVLLVAVLGTPAAADAATFCVTGAPACSGTAVPTLEAGISGAAANGGGSDTIELPAGTFSGSYSAAAGNPVEIEGVGSDTVLTRPVAGTVLTLSDPASAVRDLTVRLPAGTSASIGVSGPEIERVRIEQADNTGQSFGWIPSSSTTTNTMTRGQIVMNEGYGVFNFEADRGTKIERSSIEVHKLDGIFSRADLAIVGTTVVAPFGIEAHGSLLLDSSLVFTQAENGPSTSGVEATAQTADQTTDVVAQINHSTIIGPDNGDGTGVEVIARSDGDSGAAARLDLENSIVLGFKFDIGRYGSGPTNPKAADFRASRSRFKTPIAQANTGAYTDLGGNTSAVPQFVNPGFFDYRLRPNQPLFVDGAQDTGGLPIPGFTELDLAGKPRQRDGDGDGTVVRDMGAFEYQRLAPVVTAQVAPASVLPGVAAAFTATATDPDGDDLTFAGWTFDDGTTGAVTPFSKAFTVAGAHTGVAKVTDPTGLSTSATATLAVTAPPAPPKTTTTVTPPPALPPVVARDGKAERPSLASRTLRLRKGKVQLRLACPKAETSGCRGSLRLVGPRKLALGRASFTLRAGQAKTVAVTVPRRARSRIGRRARGVSIVLSYGDGAGNTGTATLKGTVRR